METTTTRTGLWSDTKWTLIGAAAHGDAAGHEAAWRELIKTYHRPIEACLRAQQGGACTQQSVDDFFGYLYENRILARADRRVGKLRAFIQGVIRNFCRTRRRRPRWMPRHGNSALTLIHRPANGTEAPNRFLDRAWALEILDAAIRSVRSRAERRFALEILFSRHGAFGFTTGTCHDLALRFGITESAVTSAVHRAKGWLRRAIEREVRASVSSSAELNSELDALCAVLCEIHA